MISKTGTDLDIILISGEYYDDHPLSPLGVIARVLDAKGYRVGIIEKPKTKADFMRLGTPAFCFGISSGSVDSMVHNYTPLKRSRAEDPYSRMTDLPDRALIYYCNKIKEYHKSSVIVIGGIEASLRRFAHYDYWDNNVRRSMLLDSRANILVYGNGEKQIVEIADRLKNGEELLGIAGTCILAKEPGETFELLPSFTEVKSDKQKFCDMQMQFNNRKDLAQEYTNSYILQYRYPEYTTADLDRIYSLNYSRKLHPQSMLKMGRFSVVLHRGCFGACNFCSLSLHEGDRVISRSEESVLEEIKKLTDHPRFKGYIDDLVGPSSNMYGMDCANNSCDNDCFECGSLDRSHEKLLSLLKKARKIKGVKKIFIRSGIRYDLAMESKNYISTLCKHHISGTLKIAPEHFADEVLTLMNKDNSRFGEFLAYFSVLSKNTGQDLRYYFMVGHPGDDAGNVKALKNEIKKLNLKNLEQFQLFTPTPMTVSTCMYWTGMNPETGEKVKVAYKYGEKKKLKRELLALLDRYGSKEDRVGRDMDWDRGE
jgi:uncharacterized radical SAM protein YgiQ